jgi:LL-diaminopimelate aminotransferase
MEGFYLKIGNRTSRVPVYIFSKLDKLKRELSLKGIDIIDLGIGDPDMATPDFIVNNMIDSIKNSKNHKYPPYRGIDEYKKAVANYYKERFNVILDYENEVAALIGSKEGIAHLILAATDNEDYIILPDPAYPVYYGSAAISGCNIYKVNLLEKNDYLPRLETIYYDVAKKAKMMIVNYPNNPTGAVANSSFYEELIRFGRENDIIIVNDGAYMDICNNENDSISLLQTKGAIETGVEFGSLSKSYNMTGWRIGYIAGNKEIIDKLMVVKTNFDSGQFSAIQYAGVAALSGGQHVIQRVNKIYMERRKIISDFLVGKGVNVYSSKATFYVWFENPSGYKSEEFAGELLERTGVLITPGNAFGVMGEGYCRISLTVDNEKLKEALIRIDNAKIYH